MYNSNIVAGTQVDLPNYITELLIINQCKKYKKSIPTTPFWKKEYAGLNKDLSFLSKNYALELTAIKDLLLLFAPKVLLEYFKSTDLTTVRFLKKENRMTMLYRLCHIQVKYIRSLENIDISKFEKLEDKSQIFEQLSQFQYKKNLLGKLE
jgi:hypothetical protein